MTQEIQRIDLYKPIASNRIVSAPLVLRIGVTPSAPNVEGGTLSSSMKIEEYVLLSALPEEIQRRVRMSIDVLVAGR